MAFLSENDKQVIAAAIEQAESHSCGEFITVIAQSADEYLYIPTLWAALAALLVPGIIGLNWWPWAVSYGYELQVVTFVVFALLFRWRPIKRLLIPEDIKRQRAHRLALEQFFQLNLHQKQQRTGILLFVSISEHYVEIIADKGVADVVRNDVWEDIVSSFTQQVKAGEVVTGFLQAISACEEIMVTNFPNSGERHDALPNHLIEI